MLVLVGGVLGARRLLARRRVPPTPVRVHRVVRGQVRDLVSSASTGRVAARREATLRAEVAGTVLELHHRRGERVAAGEPLLSYDAGELRDRVRLAESALALARAQAAQSAASAQVALSNVRRARTLRAHEVTPAAELEGLEGQSTVAERAASASRTALQQGAVNVQLAQDALRHAVLRAPFAGLVLETMIEQGEVTAPGTPVLLLADTSELRVDADLDEADLGRVQVGMGAEISLDAFQGQRFAGTLTEIAPSVTRDVRGNRSVAMRVRLAPDVRLRVGMSADVDVVVAMQDNVLWVPPTAVLGRGTDRAVLRVENGVVRRRRIEVGVSTWEAVEVRSGLTEGDDVVVSLSSGNLEDGTSVRVQQREAVRGEREGNGR
jgi:HlyD family secretion protein